MWKTIDNRLIEEDIELLWIRLALSGFADERS
jgi:hypothetical protein